MAIPKPIRSHLHVCLSSTPAALQALLADLPKGSKFWTFQPDPERFTPREVLAHLADWNPIFAGRISMALDEDHPTIRPIDEERLAVDNDYAHQDPLVALARYVESRKAMVDSVSALTDPQWGRTAHREDMGEITVTDMVVLVAIHDAYHLRQISEYLELWHRK